MNPYYTTYFCGFPASILSEERYREAVDCGFNLLQIEHGSVRQKQETLRFCEKQGVWGSVHDPRIAELVYGEAGSPEETERTVRQVCLDYRDYPALYGYNIMDEPGAGKFPLLARIVALFRKYDPERVAYINLFPDYATPEQLGCASYGEYLERFVEIVRPSKISCDHYHLTTDNRPGEDITITDTETARRYCAGIHRIDNAGFYNNLEAVRNIGLKYGLPYMLIILLTEHGCFRYLTPDEISFEAYQTLAYGCTTLSYFRYWASEKRPPFWRDQNSLLSGDGIRCQHYYDVQRINAEIRPVGERIAQTVSETVFHVGEEADRVRPFTGYGRVGGIGGGRYTVGFFRDGSFLIANKDYINSSLCRVETEDALEIFDGTSGRFLPAASGSFLIPAGGGVYLRTCRG